VGWVTVSPSFYPYLVAPKVGYFLGNQCIILHLQPKIFQLVLWSAVYTPIDVKHHLRIDLLFLYYSKHSVFTYWFAKGSSRCPALVVHMG
jgi:hypothetical protein